jgi:predicted dehydrogenase
LHKTGVGIIGSGAIALANHVPGLTLCPEARLVALCDENEQILARAASRVGIEATCTDYRQLLKRDDVHAVIIATPNFTHPDVVEAACAARKHVLCEKPLALTLDDARRMLRAAEEADIRHMTAFTYRFVPAMRYMKHLIDTGAIGTPLHFRAQRFQDWGDRPLGWRQIKRLAGTGEMADMLSHRIDYGHHLLGPIARLVADLRTFVPMRGNAPSDVDDWVAMLAEFEAGPTGVLESTKLATGRGEGHRGRDAVEINGTEGTLVYSTQHPFELERGRKGGADLEPVRVPREFLTWPGSPRDPQDGDPLVTFRYDQTVEFIAAIRENRDCRPSFRAGVAAQAVMEAAEQSAAQRRWIDVASISS